MLTAMYLHICKGIFHPECNVCVCRTTKNVTPDRFPKPMLVDSYGPIFNADLSMTCCAFLKW